MLTADQRQSKFPVGRNSCRPPKRIVDAEQKTLEWIRSADRRARTLPNPCFQTSQGNRKKVIQP
jgi:hypothetical protein